MGVTKSPHNLASPQEGLKKPERLHRSRKTAKDPFVLNDFYDKFSRRSGRESTSASGNILPTLVSRHDGYSIILVQGRVYAVTENG